MNISVYICIYEFLINNFINKLFEYFFRHEYKNIRKLYIGGFSQKKITFKMRMHLFQYCVCIYSNICYTQRLSVKLQLTAALCN